MSDARTGFTRFVVLNWKPPDGYRERLTRKQTTSRRDTLWPEMRKHMSDALKRKEKQKWAIEKPMLNNARKLRVIYFIDPDEGKFEDMMPAAMPCRLQQLHDHRETCCTVGQHKTKYVCTVEADESIRIRMEGSQSKNHEGHIAGRVMNSLSHYNILSTTLFLYLKP